MSRIFGTNNHNTNVHNTNCTHFQMENGKMFVRAKLTAVGIATLMSCRPKRETSVT